MKDIFQITTPVHGTTDIEVSELIKELQQKLRLAKADNRHYDWGCTRYFITMNSEGQLWLSGHTEKDQSEI